MSTVGIDFCIMSILAAAAAVSLVVRPTCREFIFLAAGCSLSLWVRRLTPRFLPRPATARVRVAAADDNGKGSAAGGPAPILREKYVVTDLQMLRDILPAGASGSSLGDAPKVVGHLDEQMLGFVARSPFLQLATVDPSTGRPSVSPKGDAAGFVRVVRDRAGRGVALQIPDRPGNRLLFGLQNIVRGGGGVALSFEIPGNPTTLRCGGTARLTADPELLRAHAARGVDATMVVVVEVEHAFFHCSKAYLRARLWRPDAWPAPEERYKVCFGPYFHRDDETKSRWLDDMIDKHYREVDRAVRGELPEPD